MSGSAVPCASWQNGEQPCPPGRRRRKEAWGQFTGSSVLSGPSYGMMVALVAASSSSKGAAAWGMETCTSA